MNANGNAHAPDTLLDEQQTISVDEAAQRFIDQWLLMRVTEYDAQHLPHAGVIVARGPSRESIQSATVAAGKAQEQGASYYLFQAFRPLQTTEEWRATLAASARRGAAGGRKKR